MRRKPIIAAALAVALVAGASIAPAQAYFTDTTQATGTVEIKFGTTTRIQEWYAERVKHVSIGNDADSDDPVWVRAKMFVPAGIGYEVAFAGTEWVTTPDANGWYYYRSTVAPGADTSEFTVTLTFPTVKSDAQPDGDAVYGDNYNVIVVYEAVPADGDNAVSAYTDVTWVDSPANAEGGE